jgi:hypothetical protein
MMSLYHVTVTKGIWICKDNQHLLYYCIDRDNVILFSQSYTRPRDYVLEGVLR